MLTKGLYGQWRYSTYDRSYLFGKDLAIYLLGKRESKIEEGSVLMLCPNRYTKIAFQVQYSIDLMRASNSDFMYMAPGSMIDMISGSALEMCSCTPKFQHCRMPTITELELYDRFNII